MEFDREGESAVYIFELDALELGEFLDGLVRDVDRYVELRGATMSEGAVRSRRKGSLVPNSSAPSLRSHRQHCALPRSSPRLTEQGRVTHRHRVEARKAKSTFFFPHTDLRERQLPPSPSPSPRASPRHRSPPTLRLPARE